LLIILLENKMTISIIIPTLNEAKGLPETLSALQTLRAGGVEVIVVDGGSSDETMHIAQQYADCVVASEAGRAKQMNKGASIAKGDILLFLHSDTTLPGDAYQQLRKFEGQAIVWGRFNVTLDNPRFIFRVIEKMMNARSRLTSVVTGDQAMFVSSFLFKQVDGFPIIDLMEDIAISKKLKKLVSPVSLKSAVVTSSRRWVEYGVMQTVLLMWWLRAAYFFNKDPAILAKKYRDCRVD
jgi:rSAM/selenodomain-associated transferase 2